MTAATPSTAAPASASASASLSSPDEPLAGAATLSHLGVIAADGEDAASFLHGQLTQDITLMPLGQARLAGYCSAKGRLLASFLVWKESAQELRLLCSADLLAPTLKRLSMFVLRAKVKLRDATPELRVSGVAGAPALALGAPAQAWERTTQGQTTLIRLPDVNGLPRVLHVAPADAPALADTAALPLASWQWLDVESGIPTIVAPVVEQFVPQMINLESVGGVNFQKGCYPGQEVVARSQYRGTLKRRGFIVHADTTLVPGQELFHSADPGQPSGMIVNAAPRPGGGWSAFAELKLAAAEGGELHAGSPDGPAVRLAPLPYTLAAQA